MQATAISTPSRLTAYWEALAFLSPIALFSVLAGVRVYVFATTGSAIALLNGVGLVVLTCMFVIRKPPKDVDRSFRSLAAALVGNFLPFAFLFRNPSDRFGEIPTIVTVITIVLATWTVLSLRTSMGVTPANRGIKTGGPYRFVRHPLYVCVVLQQLGLLMEYPSLFNVSVLAIAVVFKAMMIMNEERVLERDPAYQEYRKQVRWRAIPGVI